ncbi:hypothetical protein FRX31_021740, partial [Thalictrum thalictroides]
MTKRKIATTGGDEVLRGAKIPTTQEKRKPLPPKEASQYRYLKGGGWRHSPTAQTITKIEVVKKFKLQEFEVMKADGFKGEFKSDMIEVTYAMLEIGFKLPLEREVAKLLAYYDVAAIQMPLSFWLLMARARKLEDTYGRRFGFSEVARLIKLVYRVHHFRIEFQDQGRRFGGFPTSNKVGKRNRYIIIGDWNRTEYQVRNVRR